MLTVIKLKVLEFTTCMLLVIKTGKMPLIEVTFRLISGIEADHLTTHLSLDTGGSCTSQCDDCFACFIYRKQVIYLSCLAQPLLDYELFVDVIILKI